MQSSSARLDEFASGRVVNNTQMHHRHRWRDVSAIRSAMVFIGRQTRAKQTTHFTRFFAMYLIVTD